MVILKIPSSNLFYKFSLLYGFYEIATKKLQYNILIIGLDGSGKTVKKKKNLKNFSKVSFRENQRKIH